MSRNVVKETTRQRSFFPTGDVPEGVAVEGRRRRGDPGGRDSCSWRGDGARQFRRSTASSGAGSTQHVPFEQPPDAPHPGREYSSRRNRIRRDYAECAGDVLSPVGIRGIRHIGDVLFFPVYCHRERRYAVCRASHLYLEAVLSYGHPGPEGPGHRAARGPQGESG